MSGRKLGSESFTILSHDNPIRKLSNTSNIDPTIDSKDFHESTISKGMVSNNKISGHIIENPFIVNHTCINKNVLYFSHYPDVLSHRTQRMINIQIFRKA